MRTTALRRRLAPTTPNPKRFHSGEAVKAVIDFTAGIYDSTSGLIGDWSVHYYGPDGKLVGGLLAGQAQVLADAKACGFKASQLQWTKAARDAAWRAFRAYYGKPRRATGRPARR